MAKPKHGRRPGTAAKAGAARTTAPANTRGVERPASAASTAAASTASKRASERTTAASTSVRAARGAPSPAARTRAKAGNPRRRALQAPWWRRGNTAIYGSVVVVLLLVALFVYISRSQTLDIGAQPAPASVVNAITHVSPTVISTVGTGGITNQLHAIPGAAILKGPGGKPEILYIGAGYCPYCAAERWSMIVALSRFGDFKNLQITHSSTSDVYPNTPTFTFYGSTYTSQYIEFVAVEETGQDQTTALQTPTKDQQAALDTYDTTKYVGNLAGGIPFLDIGNRFVAVSSAFSPQLLADRTWQDIASALSDPTSPTTQSIVGAANYITAAICAVTNDQPASVCTAAPIPQIEQQLPKGQ